VAVRWIDVPGAQSPLVLGPPATVRVGQSVEG
jgi:hypothetical protein